MRPSNSSLTHHKASMGQTYMLAQKRLESAFLCIIQTFVEWLGGICEFFKLDRDFFQLDRRLTLTRHFEVRSSSTQVGTASLASPYRHSSNCSALSDGSKLISQVRMLSARASDTNPAAG